MRGVQELQKRLALSNKEMAKELDISWTKLCWIKMGMFESLKLRHFGRLIRLGKQVNMNYREILK